MSNTKLRADAKAWTPGAAAPSTAFQLPPSNQPPATGDGPGTGAGSSVASTPPVHPSKLVFMYDENGEGELVEHDGQFGFDEDDEGGAESVDGGQEGQRQPHPHGFPQAGGFYDEQQQQQLFFQQQQQQAMGGGGFFPPGGPLMPMAGMGGMGPGMGGGGMFNPMMLPQVPMLNPLQAQLSPEEFQEEITRLRNEQIQRQIDDMKAREERVAARLAGTGGTGTASSTLSGGGGGGGGGGGLPSSASSTAGGGGTLSYAAAASAASSAGGGGFNKTAPADKFVGRTLPPLTANGNHRWKKPTRAQVRQDQAQKAAFESFAAALLHSTSPFMAQLRMLCRTSLPHIKVDQRFGKRGAPETAVMQFIVAPMVVNYRPRHFHEITPGDLLEFHFDFSLVLKQLTTANCIAFSYGPEWKPFLIPYCYVSCRDYKTEVCKLCPQEIPNSRSEAVYEDDIVKDVTEIVLGIDELSALRTTSFLVAMSRRVNLSTLYVAFDEIFAPVGNYQIQIRDFNKVPSTYLLKTSHQMIAKLPEAIVLYDDPELWHSLPVVENQFQSGRGKVTSSSSTPAAEAAAAPAAPSVASSKQPAVSAPSTPAVSTSQDRSLKGTAPAAAAAAPAPSATAQQAGSNASASSTAASATAVKGSAGTVASPQRGSSNTLQASSSQQQQSQPAPVTAAAVLPPAAPAREGVSPMTLVICAGCVAVTAIAVAVLRMRPARK